MLAVSSLTRCRAHAPSRCGGFRPHCAASLLPTARVAALCRPVRRVDLHLRAASGDAQVMKYDLDELDSAKDALDLGQALCRESRWGEALAIFEKALTLPGTGLKRFRDKPKGVSDGEKQAALYNIACCHSRMDDTRTGLVSLAGCLEAGYEDFKQIRTDPDLETLRADPRFEALLTRFEPKKGKGIFGMFG